MEKGKVKWFDRKKGYGFVTMSDGKDVYVHYSGIQAEGFKYLVDGEEVEFEVQEDTRGPKAVNVVRLNPPPEKERPRRAEF
ncbi:MAG: cold-shock protein [Candidatus Omnitrophica bacterium]|nr:cold-shock protein [Candidatus Omnitrophota bacterium]